MSKRIIVTHCERTACKVPIAQGEDCYLIYNQPATGEPRTYCHICGPRIIEPNQEHDETKLRFEIVQAQPIASK